MAIAREDRLTPWIGARNFSGKLGKESEEDDRKLGLKA